MREEELLQRLREAFQAEAGERLGTIFENLALFEKCFAAAERASLVEILYRDAHSLKGAARAVNIIAVEQLCQSLETFLALLKEHNPEPDPGLLDLLYDSSGLLEKVIAKPDDFTTGDGLIEYQVLTKRLDSVAENGLDSLLVGDQSQITVEAAAETEIKVSPDLEFESGSAVELKTETETDVDVDGEKNFNQLVQPDQVKPEKISRQTESLKAPVSAPHPVESLRIAANKLDELMLVAEEFISLKLALKQHRLMLKEILLKFPAWDKEWERVKSNIESTETLNSDNETGLTVQFMEYNYKFITGIKKQVNDIERRVESECRFQSGLVDDLLGRVRNVAMLPIATLFAPLSRMVREVGRELGKQVDFSLVGETIEVDRRVLEEMKDPLIHLLRNAVDHGLEDPKVRAAGEKPAVGKISCVVAQNDAGSIDIDIVDDGQGIDCGVLQEKARSLQLISEKDEVDDDKLLELIFHSGFSTSSIITELSGRGLGMAIVREKIENLGGWIKVASQVGIGSKFSIHLPVTMAISRGVLVLVAGRKFVLPSLKVERVLQVKKEMLRNVEGSVTVVDEGRIMALVDLTALLGLTPPLSNEKRSSDEEISLVVVGHSDRCRALIVDEVVGEQEIQIKDLGKQLLKVKNISGTTILGSGQVVPILDVGDILKASSTFSGAVRADGLADETQLSDVGAGEHKNCTKLLVVDDSITSRMLLQNILEAAKYQVTTAVDGAAALTILKTEEFDLVVSDVEMPRMNGFKLTESIRADEKLRDIPLILVTSLGSREDRERGVAAGANAYIVKGEFDQNNLLQVIEKLL